MRECRHDRRRSGSRNAVPRADEGYVTDFIANPVVCALLEFEDRVDICRIRDVVKDADERIPRMNNAERLSPDLYQALR